METTHTLKPSAGLTETGLKWIALVTMVLDHIHYFFGFTGAVPEWFSMAGRVSAPLFLFCLVEGFTHTASRKKYFAKVYVLSAAMSALLFLMAFGGILVRPRRVLPGERHDDHLRGAHGDLAGHRLAGAAAVRRGLAAVLIPLAWPILANLLSVAFPALATPLGFAAYSVLPTWGTTGDSGWPVLVMGLVLYLFRSAGRSRWRPSPSTMCSTGWSIWASWSPP